MNLQEALEIVLNEAEMSALGDSELVSDQPFRVLKAVEFVREFYEEIGVFFENYTTTK
jgi:hypothetical protein|tara:strand:+ start:436 stop:609 length:174 start_codon:yes stop_codon:yes gene_type:complete